MAVDPFAERLAIVRERFVSALEGKIEDTFAALPDPAGETAAPEAVDATYRRIHGIGPTVGFAATWRAARPHEAERGLTAEEVASLRQALQLLR
jgi:hypothetical protein